MKTIYLTLLFFLMVNCVSAQGIVWESSGEVAMAMHGNRHPRVVMDGSENPMVLWGSVSNKVQFSRWTGSAFSSVLSLNPVSVPAFTASWAGPDIAAQADLVYAVYKHTPEDTTHIYLVKSEDAGLTFGSPVVVDEIGSNKSRFPTVTIDEDGNPIIAYMKFDASWMDPRWVICRSDDGGLSFTPDTLGSGWSGGEVCDCCPAALCASSDYTAITYRDNESNIRDIWAGISNDDGQHFSSGMNVDQGGWMIMACPSSGPDAVIVGDSLYTVYMSSAAGMSLVYLSRSALASPAGNAGAPLSDSVAGLSFQNYPRIHSNGKAAAIVWKQQIGMEEQLILQFTTSIEDGFNQLRDTVDVGDITNADVAVGDSTIIVVWQDDADGTVKYRIGHFENESSSGLTSPIQIKSIGISPNPASGTISIGLNETINESLPYRIFDTKGQLMQEDLMHFSDGRSHFSIEELAVGSYLIELRTASNTAIATFIKQ